METAASSAVREPGRQTIVRDVMRPAVTTVEIHSHLAAAAFLMRRARDSAVVVIENDATRRPIAIITEADVTGAVAEGKDANEVRIDELLGPDPVTVGPETRVSEAADVMLSARMHHLPVVEDDHLVGIFDMTDACRALVSTSDV